MAKGDKFYFENFSACATLAKNAANYLVECLEGYDADKIDEMLVQMHTFEHGADIKKHEMNETLAKAFVTPVDREDLDMLSQQLDNVCDTIEEILQKFYIYNIKTIDPAAIEFAKNLVKPPISRPASFNAFAASFAALITRSNRSVVSIRFLLFSCLFFIHADEDSLCRHPQLF